jgi:hypothetical protein
VTHEIEVDIVALSRLQQSSQIKLKSFVPLKETKMNHDITFVRLPQIARREIIAHMSDPRVAEHMNFVPFSGQFSY